MKIFLTILTVFWMAVIFFFSAQSADESTNASHTVGRVVGRIIISGFEQWEPEEQEEFASRIDFCVRKTSHAMEYAILCIFISLLLHSFGVPVGRCFWLSILCTAAYAATDEIHQLFVPGRSGRIGDVLIDSMGAVVGGSIIRIIRMCRV